MSKLYANVPAKIRTTIREDSRNFEGNVLKFRRMLEACFKVLKSAANFRGCGKYIVQCKKAFASFDQPFA